MPEKPTEKYESVIPPGGRYLSKQQTLMVLIFGGMPRKDLLTLPDVSEVDVEEVEQELKKRGYRREGDAWRLRRDPLAV